ncbi:MAG: hypothetical protein KKA31_06290 [Candidatus Margulisbacteria bacterium]|nr:hypothetical protein [Candidatus Margulisiibacteriota bacterium]
MRRIVAICLLLIFAAPCFADLEAKKEEYLKVKEYLNTLDKKIVEARQKRQINRLAELKDIKRNVIARANNLKAEIDNPGPAAAVEKKAEKKAASNPIRDSVLTNPNYFVSAGYGGGAVMAGFGFVNPVMPGMDLVLGLNLGLGNNVTVIDAGVATQFPFADNYLGVELDMVNYSNDVSDIPGLNKVEKGFRAGFGVYGGKNFGQLGAQLGYNTALGLTAKLIFNF